MTRHSSTLRAATALALLLVLAACGQGGPTGSDNRTGGLQPAFRSEISALARPVGVEPEVWQQLNLELERVLAAAGAEKMVARVPDSDDSKVDDLSVDASVAGQLTFRFHYHNCGDYNQDGRVAVSDLSPIGIHFQDRAGSPTWVESVVVDGDKNGIINVADLTPIGIHYLTQAEGYELQSSSDPNAPVWTVEADIPFDTSLMPADHSERDFSFTLSGSVDQMWYRVQPYRGSGAAREHGVLSNEVYFGLGQIDPPADVSASQGSFPDHIALSWNKSVDAINYRVFRDTQDTPLAELGDVNAYDDFGLSGTTPHTYWVQAVNGVRVSNFSAPATGWLQEVITTQDPPTNVLASDGSLNDRISISWTKAAGATSYEIYRDSQNNLLASLGDVASYEDYVADAFAHTYWLVAIAADSTRSVFSDSDTGYRGGSPNGSMLVLAYNDLGMHCMNDDFSEFMILPPYNTLHAMIINRGSGGDPSLVQSGVTVRYSIPGNSYSVGKTNFWDFENLLFGVDLAPNIGLTGHGLSGEMSPTGGTHTDWSVTGIPITPVKDDLSYDPYQLATVSVWSGGQELTSTQAVVPVSWEISCNLCHDTEGISMATDILRKHDKKHGTDLENSKPVVCGACHAQPELGMPGNGVVPSLSSAIHSAHQYRMDSIALENKCYACHPGQTTHCLRDVHYSAGIACVDCHGGMDMVGDPVRQPWVDEPRCDNCHVRAGFEFEQPGTLYRDSLGHHGVQCSACHGSPHAITPTVVEADNLQAIAVQGYPGVINKCEVCHGETPEEAFQHYFGGGED